MPDEGAVYAQIGEEGFARLRHVAFPIDAGARDRWLALMDRALEEARLRRLRVGPQTA